MADEICAFCLGGSTEIPPFGTLKDARDLVYPCSTCSLVTHRKCLVDWFNSVPPKLITREYTSASTGTDTPNENQDNSETVIDPIENTFNVAFRLPWFSVSRSGVGVGAGIGGVENDTIPQVHPNHSEYTLANAGHDLLRTPCPQCKNMIKFQIQLLRILSLNSLLRRTVSDTVQYSTILLGITGAATGIITMGYVGLARGGVAIVDALVPVSLISPIFQRRAGFPKLTPQRSLLALINGLSSSFDPTFAGNQFKFQHITLLPIMLYRMRYLLIFDCLLPSSGRPLLQKWIGEILVCNYVSSLGNHTLAKQLYRNFNTWLARAAKNRLSLFKLGLLFKGIDWWNPTVMVALTIPARWAYDLVYRMTANRVYFDLNASVRPLDISNHLTPQVLSHLEGLKSLLAGVQYNISQRLHKAGRPSKNHQNTNVIGLVKEFVNLFRDCTFYKLVRLKALYWYCKLKACLQHDFSSSLLYRLAIVTGVTTVLWPFVSADLGRLIYSLFILKIPSVAHVDKEKLIFLSNLIGMALVAFLKDTGNLFLCYQKARQLSELTVVTQREESHPPRQSGSGHAPRFPGTYEH